MHLDERKPEVYFTQQVVFPLFKELNYKHDSSMLLYWFYKYWSVSVNFTVAAAINSIIHDQNLEVPRSTHSLRF